MTVCVAGKNRVAVDCMLWFAERYPDYEKVACVNATDTGVDTWQPSYEFFCKNNNIRIVRLKELYEVEDLIFISLEYDKILHPSRFATSQLYNVHFSKLPAYKGMYTSILPLVHGAEESAVTLHKIDAGIDTGDIIDQKTFCLTADITGRELYELYLNNSIYLFKNNIEGLLNNTASYYSQPAINSSYFSKSTIDFKNIQIDLNKTAFEIHNQVRAFTFREYQLPVVNNTPVYKSELLNTKSVSKPGIAFKNEWYYIYDTIDFQIKIWIDKEGKLIEAAQAGDIKTYQTLKENSYPVNTVTKQGWNALIVAAYYDQKTFVEQLLNEGWDINSCNYKGTSVFMYAMTIASKQNKRSVFDFLCTQPIDLKHCDCYGRDVLSYAMEYGNNEIITILKKLIN